MTAWLGLILDTVLIGVVGVGVVQAMRLIQQLRDLRASRTEMERFVRDFNGAVGRAEAGIKALRSTARESGDDLERLIEKAGMVRDELHFLVESADGVAERLSSLASKTIREPAPVVERKPISKVSSAQQVPAVEQRAARKPAAVSAASTPKIDRSSVSRAEEELIQALKKMG